MTDVIHTRVNSQSGKLEAIAETGRATMSAYCANLVSQCEQKRIAIARRVAGPLAEMRARINKIDHWLTRESAQLAHEMDAERAAGGGTFESPLPKTGYWGIAALFCGLEVLVNKYGLDGLRASEFSSWAMALLASLAMFALGKFTASVIRQAPWRRGEYGGAAIAVAGNIGLVFVTLHIAEARAFVAEQEAILRHQSVMDGMANGFVAFVLLGYLAMLGLSYAFTNGSYESEQRSARIARLRKALNAQWEERVRLAKGYNRALAEADHDLESQLHDLAERSHQFRCGSMRGEPTVPAYFRHALPLAAVKPIHLGHMLDAQPKPISDVIRTPDDARQTGDLA